MHHAPTVAPLATTLRPHAPSRRHGRPWAAGLLLLGAAASVQAAATVTVIERNAQLSAKDFANGAGPVPAKVAGDALLSNTLSPATLTLSGSGTGRDGTGVFRNTLTANWDITQTFAAAGDTLSASGSMRVSSSVQACSLSVCATLDGGGQHDNRQTLVFTVSEATDYLATGLSGSQQLITVDRWNPATSGWDLYFGLDGRWDRVATYNFGLTGAPPVSWSLSDVFLPGTYRIYNKDDFYVGNQDNVWSYEIQFKGATVSTLADPVAAIPEPGTYALMLAGLVCVAAVARRRRAG